MPPPRQVFTIVLLGVFTISTPTFGAEKHSRTSLCGALLSDHLVSEGPSYQNVWVKKPFRKLAAKPKVLSYDGKGTVALRLTSVADAAAYARHARQGLWGTINGLMQSDYAARSLFNSQREKQLTHDPLVIVFKGLRILYQNTDGKISAHSPARALHLHAAVATHMLLSPEKLFQSFNQVHNLDDAQTQREWMSVELAEEARLWPNRQATPEKFAILDGHIRALANFDRRARQSKNSYASPFQIPENIVLSRIWLDHYLASLDTQSGDDSTRLVLANNDVLRSFLRRDVITVHENLYEVWRKSPDEVDKKRLVTIMDDAQLLMAALGANLEQSTHLRKAEETIHEPPTPPIEMRIDDQIEAPESLAALEPFRPFVKQATDAIESAGVPDVRPLPDLKLDLDGTLTLGIRTEAAPETEINAWALQLNRNTRKRWLRSEHFSTAKGKQFFKRVTNAFAKILESGYYEAINSEGFPAVKQIRGDTGKFELVFRGSGGRVVYRLDSAARTITITSMSASHKVSY